MSFVNAFSGYVRNIAIFIIFATFIEIAAPNSKYKAYINLTLGFVLIFIVLSPLSGLFGNFAAPIDELIDGITGKISADVISREAAYYSDAQKRLVLDEYKARLAESVKARINAEPGFEYVSSEFEVNEGEEGFGELISISVVARERAPEQTARPFVRVEPVTIESASVFSPAKEGGSNSGQAGDGLKKMISDFYNLSDNNIYVIVIEN